jgi:NADPH:quinone reductase
MRAFELHSYEGPAGLRPVEIPAPTPDDGHVVLDVGAIGINFPDLLMTRGQYQHRPDLPVVPGCEVAGTVRSAPAGSGWSPGERAAAFVWQGSYAEQVAVPLHTVTRAPAGLDLASTAAMVVNYHTVHFALVRRARVAAGETVLVLGAGGGIGTAGLQVARGLGARVVAGVATDQQEATARTAGTDEVVRLEEGFSEQLKELTGGRGVDVVLDPLGDWLFDEAIRGLAPEGRLLVVGFAAGSIPTLKVNRLLLRNASAVGVAFGAFLGLDPELMEAQGRSLAEMVDAGVVAPHISERYGFDELPEALERLARGGLPGKAVVEVPGQP